MILINKNCTTSEGYPLFTFFLPVPSSHIYFTLKTKKKNKKVQETMTSVPTSLLLTLFSTLLVPYVTCNDNLQIAYQWKQVDFEFRNDQDRHEAMENGTFIPANIIPMGLEVYQNRLFMTMPRWKNGVPATLAYIDLNGESC